ncbi:hypothetical protein SLS57_007843 [Botryosphaeria dothidea]
MNFTPQDLTHYLLSAGGAITSDERGVYLVSESKNDLVEKLWTGTEISDQVFITSGVRKDTAALYLLDGEERCVFCVDANNILQCYKYDVDEEEWLEFSL